MAVFAKGMTNGYPVTAVIGVKEVMEAAQSTFISSTFWTERVGFAGALKSIECYEKYEVAKRQSEVGTKISEGWKSLETKYYIKLQIGGILPLIHMAFDYENPLTYKTFFTQEMLKEGFLAGPGVYASLAHTDEIIDKYMAACDRTFAKVAKILENKEDITNYLDGPICHAGFERLN
jgi:glutamate-1-semialdehyde aminotransferase